ncbi:MAG: disulfide bond formation protein DsbA [Acidimicrobiia bacterium]|nr:disulfide bond formation protein DsbA [Acidimicrobiia bacterium]
MNRKMVFGISAIVLVAGFVIASSLYKSQRAEKLGFMAQESASTFIRDHSPMLGDAGAKVYIVKFTDPACETCAVFSDFVKQAMAAYPGKIRLVIRYAPFHEGSSDAVRILLAAKKRDKFWETLDVLYASQEQWTQHHQVMVDRVWPLLARAGLDVAAIRAEVNDPEMNRIIQQDLTDARTLDVRKTPGLFVNGKPLEPFGAREFKELIESELRSNYPELTR